MEELSNILGNHYQEYDDIYLLSENKYYNYYNALSKKDKQFYILKVYFNKKLEDGEMDYLISQIHSEIEILNKIKSDNIITKYSDFKTDHAYVLVLEYYEQNLQQYIKDNGPLYFETSIFQKLILNFGNVLKILKENKIIHRDINPNNIIVKKDNENIIFKLANFNSAIYTEENDFEQIGDFLYAAPEINKNEIYNEKCDIWSIGMVLYYSFFGQSPYGKDLSKNIINNIIYKENFDFELSNNIILDNFLKKLLVINPDNRMSHTDFLNYIENNEFQNQLLSIDYFPKENEFDKESFNLFGKEIDIKAIFGKMINFVTGKQIFDVDKMENNNINNKNNNIIYYNDNNKYLNDVIKESFVFEQNTNGAMILCTNIISLNLIINEIQRKYKRDKRVVFNLIVNGTSCEKIIQILKKKNIYENIINNICIFCKFHNEEDYYYLMDKHPKINLVSNNNEEIINFIKMTSNEEIKQFYVTKLITYKEYKEYYYLKHKMISKFYGNISKKKYEDESSKMEHHINNKDNLKQDKNVLKNGFLSFEITDDLKKLNEMVIKEYTNDTIYKDLNHWLIENNSQNFNDSFEPVAYFTSRLMYSLNSFASDLQKYFCENQIFIFRGMKLFYTDLLPYLRVKNDIIVFTSFTSTSEKQKLAEDWSGREKSILGYKGKLLFSVVLKIRNLWKNGWISNGINIQDISKIKSEKEILFQPFSFYRVTDVIIDTNNYTADISLDTIGKKEILEEEIKNGKEIIYDNEENIMTVKKDTKIEKENKSYSKKENFCLIY